MAYQYQVEHWSTGQVAFKMPDRDLTSQDVMGDVHVLIAHIRVSPSVFDRLNKKKAVRGIYAPGLVLTQQLGKGIFRPSLALEQQLGWTPFNDTPKSENTKILHKYMVEQEGDQVRLKIDLSDYTDAKSREEALDFITTYTQALRMDLNRQGYSHFSVSIQVLGPDAPVYIAEYKEAKKVQIKSEISSKNLDIAWALFTVLMVASMVASTMVFPIFTLIMPTPILISLIMPVVVGGLVAGVVFFIAAMVCVEVIKMRAEEHRMEQEYQKICMNISPSTVLVPNIHAPKMESVFSNSSAAGLSVASIEPLSSPAADPGVGRVEVSASSEQAPNVAVASDSSSMSIPAPSAPHVAATLSSSDQNQAQNQDIKVAAVSAGTKRGSFEKALAFFKDLDGKAKDKGPGGKPGRR